MKKLLLIALSTGFLFNSCSSDEDHTEEFSIIGAWTPSREIVISTLTGTTISNTPYSACYQTSVFDFKTNNTLQSIIFEENTNGTCENTGSETVSYSYDHNAKKLIIDGEDTEIVSRTLNELQVVIDEDTSNDTKTIMVITK